MKINKKKLLYSSSSNGGHGILPPLFAVPPRYLYDKFSLPRDSITSFDLCLEFSRQSDFHSLQLHHHVLLLLEDLDSNGGTYHASFFFFSRKNKKMVTYRLKG